MPLQDFRSVPDSNRPLLEWILETAGIRIHGTTHYLPLDRFATEKRMRHRYRRIHGTVLHIRKIYKTNKLYPIATRAKNAQIAK